MARRLFGRKKSSMKLPDMFPDSTSILNTAVPTTQKGTLALPTNLNHVVDAAHDNFPRHLPGIEASEDEVRYFLYQILTMASHKLVFRAPQWVLETCMSWKGQGDKLRSLSSVDFQLLCPLNPGHAIIDWDVKYLRFKLQQIPPAGVRYTIGSLIRNVVTELKNREIGHQRPGWQGSSDPQETGSIFPSGMGRIQTSTPRLAKAPSKSSLNPRPENITRTPMYHMGNYSLPHLHHVQPINVHRAPTFMSHGKSPVTSNFQPTSSESTLRAAQYISPSDPASPVGSHTSSYCQADNLSSRLSVTTARTSPPGSETEAYLRAIDIGRSRSNASSIMTGNSSAIEFQRTSQLPTQPAPVVQPDRYRACSPSSAPRMQRPSLHPAVRLSHLRAESHCDSRTFYAQSEASLSPSDSGTYRQDPQRASTGYLQQTQSPQFGSSSVHSGASYNAPTLSSAQSYVTARSCMHPTIGPVSEDATMSHSGSAIPSSPTSSTILRPINNYRVDDHAFESAERVSSTLKSPRDRFLTGQPENWVHTRYHSVDVELSSRPHARLKDSTGGEKIVGPSVRFWDPRTGLPRLTIYEVLEEREKLEKMEHRIRPSVDLMGKPMTLYEMIEEKEILDGNDQSSVDDAAVKQNWKGYF